MVAGAIRHWSNPSLCSLFFPGYIHWRWANALHFYALFQKQSWVAVSHFWKTSTLYLFAICDTDLRPACHIFGRLTGAEIWLQDQTEGKCRCGGEIKTQSDIFLQTQTHTQASTGNQKKHPKNLISISMYVALPNGPKSGREQINEFSTVSADGCCVQMQGKLRSVWRGCRCLEGMIGCRYGSYIYTQSYIDWKLHLHSMVWYGMEATFTPSPTSILIGQQGRFTLNVFSFPKDTIFVDICCHRLWPSGSF